LYKNCLLILKGFRMDLLEKEIGITETLEIMKMLNEVSYTMGRVFADGTINAEDLGKLIELSSKFNVFIVGISGASKSIDEMKNLSADEVSQLIRALYECIGKFNEGKKIV